jgi:hypothetical protein
LQIAVRDSLADPDLPQSVTTRLFRALADPQKGDPEALVEALAGDAIRSGNEQDSQAMFDHAMAPLPNDGAPDEFQAELNELPLDQLGSVLDALPKNATREDAQLAVDRAKTEAARKPQVRQTADLNSKTLGELETMLNDATASND